MKNLRRNLFGALALVLTAPGAVLAQFDPNAGGGTNLSNTSLTGIIKNLMNWLLMMIGVLGVIGFVVSGIMYLTASGDSDILKRAKTTLVSSVIGILVALIGLIVIAAINNLLKGSGSI